VAEAVAEVTTGAGLAGAAGRGADAAYDALTDWLAAEGLTPYPHQEEAVLELWGGAHVVLATPTGSGKSVVATAAHALALAEDRVSFYTAPIKALVSEKFFALCAQFGPDNVGMLTGDAAVNADAPIIACTAEVLANIALREGASADVGLVVMDEFHFYAEPDRGWAWQVPLLTLPHAQFLLMSATLGEVGWLAEDLEHRTGREVAVVDDAERPVPLSFSWSTTALPDTLEELVTTGQGPVYVVHFTQAAAVEHATSLHAAGLRCSTEGIAEAIGGFRFGAGFGRTLSRLLRRGIGVHHAGMLPKYRRLVETLAQRGLLTVICGTDTLGVGINVPIRTVLFTGLAKFDGRRQRVLRSREFLQIAGRAGRAGYDTAGYVVVQAPEHVIENEKAKAKAAERQAAGRKKSKAQLRKPPEGTVVWTEQTFDKLVAGTPERLVSRMRMDNAMLLEVVSREEDAFPVLRSLLTDNHEDPRSQRRLARRALRLARSLVASGVLTRLAEPDQHGRRYVLTVDLPEDFALHQPLSHFALAALDLLDPEAETYPLDVVSVIEAVLEAPRPLLMAQQHAARGEALERMKAEGLDYEERMALLEEITWPQPLAELLEPAYETYRERHPWLSPDALSPKSVLRDMWEQGMTFTELVSRYQLARSEGLVLRYLTDAYRALRHTVPDAHRPPELDDLVEWLGETVRQTDSSLLDEWEALTDPDRIADLAAGGDVPPPRPLSRQERAFARMVRNAAFARVDACARDDLDALVALDAAAAARCDPTRAVLLARADWDRALEEYYAEHDRVLVDADARGPDLFALGLEHVGAAPGAGEDDTARVREVRQTLHDPEGHHDWVLDAVVDCDASDVAGEVVLLATHLHRLG
jgi:superfamily II DNA/RNA helicase